MTRRSSAFRVPAKCVWYQPLTPWREKTEVIGRCSFTRLSGSGEGKGRDYCGAKINQLIGLSIRWTELRPAQCAS